jgi:RNA polymerase sigma-70 factor (ECF subfamily)
MENDDAILIAAAQEDPAKFAALYDRYASRIYRYLYSRVDNTADAEDLTAQTFMGALEALPRYQKRAAFSTWLFTIARNKANDHFRHSRKQQPLSERLESEEPDVPTTVARLDEIQRLREIVHGLDEAERELIHLRFVGSMSFEEMGALTGKKEEAVKKALYRLLARLQSQLETSHE